MIDALRTLKYRLQMALVGIWVALATILFYLISFPFNRRKWLSWAYAQSLQMGVGFLLRIRMKVLGGENFVPGPAVIIMNHQSNFDPLLHGCVFQKNTVIIGKKELSKIPLFGRIFEATNNIMVDRKAAGKNGSAVDLSVERLTHDDCYVWIFPEGTRSQGSKMAPFKKGAFRMAVQAQVPIVPLVSQPLRFVLDIPKKRVHGGTHEVKVMPTIDTTGLTEDDIPELVGRCEELYRRELAAYLNCDRKLIFRSSEED